MTYAEFTQAQQNDFDSFNMLFAFSQEQLNEGLKSRGWEGQKLTRIMGGGFILASDKNKFSALLDSREKALKDFLSVDEQFFDAIRYELYNHEYGYTGDANSALEALGLCIGAMTDTQQKLLFKACREVMANTD
jgi:hypothetical protein